MSKAALKRAKGTPPIPLHKIVSRNVSFSKKRKNAWMAHLRMHGVVNIIGVCTPEEGEELLKLFHADLKNLGTGIDVDDRKSISNKNTPTIGSVGIVKNVKFGLAHSLSSFSIRTVCRDVFCDVLDVDKSDPKSLQVSFDGLSIFVKGTKTVGPWIHTDLGATRMKARDLSNPCVQGVFHSTAASSKSGGFCFVNDGHLDHAEYIADLGNPKADYTPFDFTNERIKARVLKSGISTVAAPAWSMTLWYSQLPHANTCATHSTVNAPVPLDGKRTFDPLDRSTLSLPNKLEVSDLAVRENYPFNRVAHYVSFCPRTSDKKTADARAKFVQESVHTNHWTYLDALNKKGIVPGPMRVTHMAYPPHKSHKVPTSVAMDPTKVIELFEDIL
jgi:hypothetical protein